MHEHINTGRRPREDGSPGWVVTLDPEQNSFKQAMIAIVFTKIWLDALLYLLIVRDHGIDVFIEYESRRHPYEDKLRLLNCSDQRILDSARRLKKSRDELVHEKAHSDYREIRTAQDEADNAYKLLVAIDGRFKPQPG